jgi:hypothetical protein
MWRSVAISALAPRLAQCLGNGILMERDPYTVTRGAIPSLSAADQITLFIFWQHYRCKGTLRPDHTLCSRRSSPLKHYWQ